MSNLFKHTAKPHPKAQMPKPRILFLIFGEIQRNHISSLPSASRSRRGSDTRDEEVALEIETQLVVLHDGDVLPLVPPVRLKLLYEGQNMANIRTRFLSS